MCTRRVDTFCLFPALSSDNSNERTVHRECTDVQLVLSLWQPLGSLLLCGSSFSQALGRQGVPESIGCFVVSWHWSWLYYYTTILALELAIRYAIVGA
jgi:hypothetical protein